MARREDILAKPGMVQVLSDTRDRLVVRWPLFKHTHTWIRVPGTEWFEHTATLEDR